MHHKLSGIGHAWCPDIWIWPKIVQETLKTKKVQDSRLLGKLEEVVGRKLFFEIVGIDGESAGMVLKFVGPPKNVEIVSEPITQGMCGYRVKYTSILKALRLLIEDGKVFILPFLVNGDIRIYGGEDLLMLGDVSGSFLYMTAQMREPMEELGFAEAINKALARGLQ